MEKTIKIIAMILFTYNLYSNELSCSKNGTSFLHIPGAFTSKSAQEKGKQVIIDLPSTVKTKLDSNKNVSIDFIPISSQGLIMDNFNYMMMSVPPGTERDLTWLAIGITEFGLNLKNDVVAVSKVGGVLSVANKGGAIVRKMRGTIKNGKFVTQSMKLSEIKSVSNLIGSSLTVTKGEFNTIKSFLREISSQDTNDPLTFSGKVLGLIDIENLATMGRNILNAASLAFIDDKFNSEFLSQHRDTFLASYFTTEKNINNIANTISEKLIDNKKLIINAHGEGNQLAESAIALLEEKGDINLSRKISKYVSIVATSPTTYQYTNKYFFIKHNLEKRLFGGSDIASNYLLNINSIPGDIRIDSKDIRYGYSFLDFYISPIVKGTKNVSNSIEKTMRNNFIDELELAALTLESNCGEAYFTYSQNNQTVTFDATDPLVPDESNLTYNWDFGDGETLTTTSKVIDYTFSTYETFKVTLQVSDATGVIRESSKVIKLNQLEITSMDSFNRTANFEIKDFNGTANSFKWNFGDGTVSNTTLLPYNSHTYTIGGGHKVEVKYIENGKEQTLSTVVNIYYPKVDIVSQPLGTFSRGSTLTYEVKCNVGNNMSISPENIQLYAFQSDQEHFTCTGFTAGNDWSFVGNGEATYKITCTQKFFPCYRVGGFHLNFYCKVNSDGVSFYGPAINTIYVDEDTTSGPINCN